jgi:peptidoglycan/xylan/chitin deacetylase (PgdA/CDA1 family)
MPVEKIVPSASPPARLRRAARVILQRALERSVLGDRLFWRVPGATSGVALTFDDGPDPEQTPRILDTLAFFGVPATFFLVGERVTRHPDIVLRILDEGHAVGNHTYSHKRCDGLSIRSLEYELKATDAAIARVCPGIREPIFRPPFGALNAPTLAHLLRAGRRVALWSRDGRDYRGATDTQVAAVVGAAAPRDVVLLHDRFPATVEALPGILETLAARQILLTPLAPVPARAGAPAPSSNPPLLVKVLSSCWRMAGSGK